MLSRLNSCFLGCLLALVLNAQPGTIDPTFNTFDTGNGNGDGPSGNVEALAVQADGRILVAGNYSEYNGILSENLVRLMPDGTVDPSFNLGQGISQTVNAIALAPDGKILIGGNFQSVGGVESPGLARLNSDGSFDQSFSVGTGCNPPVLAIALQTDGRVVCGGLFTSFNGVQAGFICRLNADGSLDPTFNVGNGCDGVVRSIVQQPDGRLLIAGDFDVVGTAVRHGICRLNSDGSLDTSFQPGNGTETGSQVWSIALRPDGRMLIGGNFSTFDAQPYAGLLQLNADGTPDATFAVGEGVDGVIHSLTINSSGQVLVGGDFLTYDADTVVRLVRINGDGSRDPSFGIGEGFGADVNAVAILTDAAMIVGGDFTDCDETGPAHCLKLSSIGAVDPAFNPGSGVGAYAAAVRCIVVQPDEKILIGGTFHAFNGQVRHNLCRLNSDGSLDPGFSIGGGFDGTVHALALQPDGKVIVGGDFHAFNGTVKHYFCRLNPDGSLDESFATSANSFNGAVRAILVLPDGKIIVGGYFDQWGNAPRPGIARVTSVGGPDSSFDTGTGAIGTGVNCLALQPDGKIIVGGYFNAWDGDFGYGDLVRLNANGSTDATFDTGSGPSGQVFTIALQASGRIILGGDFISYNGAEYRHILRLFSNGDPDFTFDVGNGFNEDVFAVVAQSDGHILVGGGFATYDGQPCENIARLNADGGLDATFQIGTGCDSWVQALAIPSGNKALVGGSFVNYNGTGKNRIMRIFTSGGIGMDEVLDASPVIALAGNPVRGDLVFSRLPEGASAMRLLDDRGTEVLSMRIRATNDIGALANGAYTLSVEDVKGRVLGVTRIVLER